MRAVSVGMLMILLTGCATTPRENTEVEIGAARQVLNRLSDVIGDSAQTGSALFEMGELDDGVAVVLRQINAQPVNAAFWTRGPAIFAVNDAARALDRRLPDAPGEISAARVFAVAR